VQLREAPERGGGLSRLLPGTAARGDSVSSAVTPTPAPPANPAVSSPGLATRTEPATTAPPSGAEEKSAPPSGAVPLARVGEALQTSIQQSLRLHSAGERWNLELRLDPPDLGTIRVVLQLDHDSLRGSVHFTDPHLEEVLERALPDLESSLRENGGNAFLDLRRDSGNGERRLGEGAPDAPARVVTAAAATVFQSDHLIDLTA